MTWHDRASSDGAPIVDRPMYQCGCGRFTDRKMGCYRCFPYAPARDGVASAESRSNPKGEAGALHLAMARLHLGRWACENGRCQVSTAIQNIERAKGASAERKWLMAEVRTLLKLYGRDVVLRALLDKLKEREAASK